MSFRIRWSTDESEGVFPLRAEETYLVWSEEVLDRLSRPLTASEDGIAVRVDEKAGRIEVEARGEIQLVAGAKSFRKVVLPPGRGVEFRAGEVGGKLLASGEVSAADPLLGRDLGGYKILGRLGAGAVGTVYRALQKNLDREVALKVLKSSAAKDPAKVASFKGEAVAAGRLSHPNLVQVHDVGEADGFYYYSMEMVTGGTLEDHLDEHGPMEWEDALPVVREAALALAFAETHHLVHRDVKPENLMLTASGHTKLADLGLAATREMMDKEAAGGTPHFMAPEAISKHGFDHRADLYSLGCTLYRLLTGETPFAGDSVREILRAHRDQPPPTLRDGGVTAPKPVEDLVASLLAKNPEDRPAHATDVAHTCEQMLGAGSSRKLVVALVVLLIGAGGYVAYEAAQPDPEPVEPEIVEVVRTDPNAAAREAALDAAKARGAYFEAKAIDDLEDRKASLQAFLATYGQSEFAGDARSDIESIDAAIEAAAAEAAAIAADPDLAKLRVLEEAVRAELEKDRFGAALLLVDEDITVPNVKRDPLRNEVLDAAREQIARWESDHDGALDARNWAAATAVRDAFAAALADGGRASENWQPTLEDWITAAGEAESSAARAAFRTSRLAWIDALQGDFETAALVLDASSAADAYTAARSGLAHPGLAAAAEADEPLLVAASRAALALRTRLERGEEIVFNEATTGKRAVLLAIESGGIRVQVQERGERVERVEPWEAYRVPAALRSFLADTLPPATPTEEADALYLLTGLAVVSAEIRAWGSRPPTTTEAEATAARLAAWVAGVPAPSADSPLRRSLDALLLLQDACTALAAGDDYLALLHLEDLQGEYSLLGAWLSDGSSPWGITP